MKKRPLLTTAAIGATAVAVFFAVRWRSVDGGDTEQERQSRAFAAAAQAVSVMEDPANAAAILPDARKKPKRARQPAEVKTVQARLAETERHIAKQQFLRYAERNSTATRQRIAALDQLSDLFAFRYARLTKSGEPLFAADGQTFHQTIQRAQRLRMKAAGELHVAIIDKTTLTPEAQRLWEQNEAGDWQDIQHSRVPRPAGTPSGDAFDAFDKSDAMQQRNNTIKALVDEFAGFDGRVEDLTGKWREEAEHTAEATAELQQAKQQLKETREQLYAAALEKVQFRDQWIADFIQEQQNAAPGK